MSLQLLIIVICAAVIGASIATVFYVYRLDATTKEDADELIERVAIKNDIDNLYEKITIIHGRLANLEKRIDPVGFEEVFAKYADKIAAICCCEYSKLVEDSNKKRSDSGTKTNSINQIK